MNNYVGTIVLFGGNYAPENWLFCDGSLLNIQQYPVLSSIIGTIYGGDGQQTFALPNLPAVSSIDGEGQSRYIICFYGEYPQRP
ncbi:MAG: tail fiber protein [Methylococcaceae bacterium]